MYIDFITEAVLKEIYQTYTESKWWKSWSKSPVWDISSIISSAPCKGNSFADPIRPCLQTLLLFLRKSFQWLFQGDPRASPVGGWCCLYDCIVHLVTRRHGMPFPGVQPILGSHLHPHEYFKFDSGWSVSHSGKQCIMNYCFCLPLSLLHKHRMLLLIYLFLECTPERESTANCIVQQFSGILQSHFISFSS
jgi:hypothetical protein